MLDAPAWLGNFTFARRHGFECPFVLVEYETIRAIADRMRLDLNSLAQCVDQHRSRLFRFHGQETGCVGRVRVWTKQRGATRTQRAIRDNFYRPQIEAILERADRWSFLEQTRGVWSWPVNGFVDTQLDRAGRVKFFEDGDLIVTAARILNLRPAEGDVALYTEHNGALRIFSRRWGHATAHHTRRRVEQHAVWFATLFVFRDLAAEWIRRALVDAGEFECGTVYDCTVTIGTSEDHRVVG